MREDQSISRLRKGVGDDLVVAMERDDVGRIRTGRRIEPAAQGPTVRRLENYLLNAPFTASVQTRCDTRGAA